MKAIKNLAGAKKGMKLKSNLLKDEVKAQVEIVGRKTSQRASNLAPVDLGKLKQSIYYEPINNGLGARITANVEYAPYQEFGTGGLIDIPKGFEDVAIKFKTGNGKISMKAQPYLIPSAKEGYQDLVKRLKKLTSK